MSFRLHCYFHHYRELPFWRCSRSCSKETISHFTMAGVARIEIPMSFCLSYFQESSAQWNLKTFLIQLPLEWVVLARHQLVCSSTHSKSEERCQSGALAEFEGFQSIASEWYLHFGKSSEVKWCFDLSVLTSYFARSQESFSDSQFLMLPKVR